VRRYAGDDVRHVVVFGGARAPRRRARLAPRRGAEPEVEVTRATVIGAEPLTDAAAWLERAAGAEGEALRAEALALVNRAVAAQRSAAADPGAADADPARALAARAGYGSGEQVAEGEWEEARDIAPDRVRERRAARLSPQERVAAVLSGRDVVLACDELVLRVRGDLEHGREREAALQARAALDAAIFELAGWRGHRDMEDRLTELAGHRGAVAVAYGQALRGGLDAEHTAAVRAAVERIEAALRARAAPA
jgi:hypothetical protein